MTTQQLLAEYELWLSTQYLSISGADGEDDDDDGDDLDDDADLDDDNLDDDDDDDDPSAELKKQLEESERKRIAAEQAAKKAKTEAREARKKAAADGGDFEAQAREALAELEEIKATSAADREAKEAAEYNLDQERRQTRVVKIASRLHFKDATDALRLLDEEDTSDDKACERALKKLATEKDYLIDRTKASGGPMGGRGGTGLTMEQIKNMSPEEVNENWAAVQETMASSGG